MPVTKKADAHKPKNRFTSHQLAAAVKVACKLKAPVIVTSLDRFGGDVRFISGLMAHKVEFFVGDIGKQENPFMLHIHAAVAV